MAVESSDLAVISKARELGVILLSLNGEFAQYRALIGLTHQVSEVYDDLPELFARPEVTADRIVMLRVIADSIDDALPRLSNGLVAKYVLTRYMLLYCVRDILRKDELWTNINTNPQMFVRNDQDRLRFRECIDNIVSDLMTDVDAEIEDAGEDFDYRGKLRDAEWVNKLVKSVVGDHLKMVARKKIQSFKGDWQQPVRVKKTATRKGP
jgi:hypothetical protein